MELQDIIDGTQPLVGEVVPIRTVQETQPAEEFADAYVAEVNLKTASKVVKVLDSKLPRDPSQPMSHLRRFANTRNLPEPLRPLLLKDKASDKPPQTIFVLIPPPLPDVDRLQDLLMPFAPQPETSSSSSSDPSPNSAGQIILHTIKVPTLPPLNPIQADRWSKTLWPVVFNPAAARSTISPPVQVLNRTHEFIKPHAGRYLALARKVSREAEQSGLGRGVGAVVVDPDIISRIQAAGDSIDSRWADAIVAVAGDARYSRREAGEPSTAERHLATGTGPNPATESYNADLEGGPDLHALMRAAEIIALKRRAGDPTAETDKRPLSPLESYFISQPDSTASDTEKAEQDSDSQDPSPVPEKYQKTGKDPQSAIPISTSTSAPTHNANERGEGEEQTPPPRIRPRSQGGYLCTDLDVYLTHEPCICCSMGLLLSRFRAVIFPRRGRMVTGGLASEPVVSPVPADDHDNAEQDQHQGQTEQKDPSRPYYGLHWRKELNWRALGFEFIEGDNEAGDGVGIGVAEDGVAFHA